MEVGGGLKLNGAGQRRDTFEWPLHHRSQDHSRILNVGESKHQLCEPHKANHYFFSTLQITFRPS